MTDIHQEQSETNPPLWDENKASRGHPRGPRGMSALDGMAGAGDVSVVVGQAGLQDAEDQ